VLCESAPGPGAVKASGSVSERPVIKGCNEVAVDRFHQACRFLASLGFPFPLRGYSDEEYRTRHHALIMRKFRWHRFGTPEVRVGLRKVGFFHLSYDVPLTNVRSFSDYSIFTPSVLVISMFKETPASRRFVWCTSRHVTMCLSVAGMHTLLYGTSRKSRVHFFRPLFSQSRQP
jgi:hypothetical protein